MQDDIVFAPPAETLTTDERLAELAAILADLPPGSSLAVM